MSGLRLFPWAAGVCALVFAPEVRLCAAPLVQQVKDESLILRALGAAFPGAAIRASEEKDQAAHTRPKHFAGLSITDLFTHEKTYEVSAPPDESETAYATDVLTDKVVSQRRSVQCRLYRVGQPLRLRGALSPASAAYEATAGQGPASRPQLGARYLLAVRYTFAGATPPMCCLAVGRLYLLSESAEGWKKLAQSEQSFLQRATRLRSIQFGDFGRNAGLYAVIEAEWSAVNALGISTHVYELGDREICELAGLVTEFAGQTERGQQRYGGRLDTKRTERAKGQRLFVSRTVYVRNNRPVRRPKSRSLRIRPLACAAGTALAAR